ncbi:hypothetical protein [Tenacibaculum amylolyticum]|uniref:hypothetical protein n=1 Tax=Tenacibaculum amylolyticum TaxID=104269 RepID=UPI0038935120
MSESEKTNKVLQQILDLISKNDARLEVNELTTESESFIDKAKKEADEATKKIQSTFDRIHDKLFNFNNMLIAAFLGLSKFPTETPILSLWMAILPILNLIYLMFMEYSQMEIYRHAAKRMEWSLDVNLDVRKYGNMIRKQTRRSLFSIFTTFGLFIFLVIKILAY